MAKDIREQLHYNPDTGVFTWINCIRGRRAGAIAGNTNSSGYRRIMFNGKEERAHRLAFLYMEGYMPEHQIDHINGVRNDNRWENLRHVSVVCNSQNRSKRTDTSSKFKGVTKDLRKQKGRHRWSVRLRHKFLGVFKTELEAAMCRIGAELKDPNWHCDAQSHNVRTFVLGCTS